MTEGDEPKRKRRALFLVQKVVETTEEDGDFIDVDAIKAMGWKCPACDKTLETEPKFRRHLINAVALSAKASTRESHVKVRRQLPAGFSRPGPKSKDKSRRKRKAKFSDVITKSAAHPSLKDDDVTTAVLALLAASQRRP